MQLSDLCYITLYVRDISEYSTLNEAYSEKINFQNPPTRVCVETCLPKGCPVIVEAVAFKAGYVIEADYRRHTMHVQGISHWAPANIGPYSQSTKIGEITYISGQIGLIPGNMMILGGGIKQECKLTLRHINRIAKAMNSHGQLRDVVQGICFVTHPNYITEARRQWVSHELGRSSIRKQLKLSPTGTENCERHNGLHCRAHASAEGARRVAGVDSHAQQQVRM